MLLKKWALNPFGPGDLSGPGDLRGPIFLRAFSTSFLVYAEFKLLFIDLDTFGSIDLIQWAISAVEVKMLLK